jgi:hypothetical protein
MATSKIVLKERDFENNCDVVTGEVSPYTLARCLSHDDFASVLDNWLNCGGKEYRDGLQIGHKLRETHRTLQRLAICFALGIIAGLSEQEYTDPRNETAIKTAQEIKRMIDNGEFKTGFYI